MVFTKVKAESSRRLRRLSNMAKRTSRSEVSMKEIGVMWLFLIVFATFLTGLAAMFDPGQQPWTLWLFIIGTLLGISVLQYIRQQVLIKRIEALEEHVVGLTNATRKPKPRSRWRRDDVVRFFDKNQTTH